MSDVPDVPEYVAIIHPKNLEAAGKIAFKFQLNNEEDVKNISKVLEQLTPGDHFRWEVIKSDEDKLEARHIDAKVLEVNPEDPSVLAAEIWNAAFTKIVEGVDKGRTIPPITVTDGNSDEATDGSSIKKTFHLVTIRSTLVNYEDLRIVSKEYNYLGSYPKVKASPGDIVIPVFSHRLSLFRETFKRTQQNT
eukprot:Platyproteum_vivax@DN3990_c0_g1_i2.p1